MTHMASSVLSSSGSRRPDELRQCTQARLQPYVNSQVRQMGASSPWESWSRSAEWLADTDHLGRCEAGEGRRVRGTFGGGDAGV